MFAEVKSEFKTGTFEWFVDVVEKRGMASCTISEKDDTRDLVRKLRDKGYTAGAGCSGWDDFYVFAERKAEKS